MGMYLTRVYQQHPEFVCINVAMSVKKYLIQYLFLTPRKKICGICWVLSTQGNVLNIDIELSFECCVLFGRLRLGWNLLGGRV